MILRGKIVDVVKGRIYGGEITIAMGKIERIEEVEGVDGPYLMPGFIDAHVHVESSMLPPTEFARLAMIHGTLGSVSDPHEIGNVLGTAGVRYMVRDGLRVPFYFCFGAPSCVPATVFETAGAAITPDDVAELIAMDEIGYLAEVMNFPGVLHGDPEVMAKIRLAQEAGKPVDGHAPGLRGEDARRYIAAGISTDHECFTGPEAREKLELGMKILIREGSAAKNFEALHHLLREYPDHMMFCSDDKHPNDLIRGHINELCARAVAHGHDPMRVIRAATLNVARHYGIPMGMLQVGDPADFIVVEDLRSFRVQASYLAGQCMARDGASLLPHLPVECVNRFEAQPIQAGELEVPAQHGQILAMVVEDGQLITKASHADIRVENGLAVSDPEQDLLKLVVVNRYQQAKPSVAFVRNFGMKKGAIAASVAHDSHNVLAVGVSDADIATAINAVIAEQGGCSAACGDEVNILPLPIAGLMSDLDGYEVARRYEELDAMAKSWGATLHAPYMTLSFCALLVIPHLKLSDLGLFDGDKFEFVSLFR